MEIYQIDAFTNRAYSGNPAAVYFQEQLVEDEWMQDVAREMNLSETAFLPPHGQDFDLRWFTPAFEVDLCGHATLASAHALWEFGRLRRSQTARFHTRSGLLTACRNGDWIEMDLPSEIAQQCSAPPDLLEALGVTPVFIGRNRFDILVVIDSPNELRELSPDHALLRKVEARGVMVTSPPDLEGYDFLSRFYAPRSGIDEGPVTGSAHCCLGPYWSTRLGKVELKAFQASPRGGILRVRPEKNRVIVSGQAVTVMKGHLVKTPT